MAVSHSGTYVQLPKLGLAQILPADTTTRKTLITAGADGNKVTGISMSTTETSVDHVMQFWVARGGVFSLLITVNLPLNSGFVIATPPVSAFALWTGLPLDNDGQKYFYLESGDVLSVSTTVTVTAAKQLDVMAVEGSF